ncbi:MAG: hypothetical protein UH071_06925 [Paludibacteraceae bacterium]|nr:hypothetical protein [Paludibacteraceae bacterium]
MKKIILSIIAAMAICCVSYAATYMRVKKNDGTFTKFNTENVKAVTVEETATVSGKIGDYSYVDLGLPSGLKWATCNVGASKPTEAGDLFAWGEVTTKDVYDYDNYKWVNADEEKMTKYCLKDQYGNVDNLEVLDSSDDAAKANWGGTWRMPTYENMTELVAGCTWVWTDDFNGSGVAGRIGTSKTNGNEIFLPATGYYWTSSLYISSNDQAYSLYNLKVVFESNGSHFREDGASVRAVSK